MQKKVNSALSNPALRPLQRLLGSLLASMVEDEVVDFRGAGGVGLFIIGAVGATLILWALSAGFEAVINA